MFTERFATPDGRARFIRVAHKAPAEVPDTKYPYVLTTGRLMTQYQSGTQTRRLKGAMVPDPHVQIHPDLARRLNIAASDLVELRTRRGAAVFRAQLSDEIRPEVLFVPFHWAGASNANALTDPALDPLSKMPEFKVCAVSLSRIGGPDDVHLLAVIPDQPAVQPFDAGSYVTGRPKSPTNRLSRSRPPSSHQLPRGDARMHTKNRFLQGIYQFTGAGIDKPAPLDAALSYVVPDGSVAQALYFRGGNTADELIALVLMRDGVPMRYFPMGAKADVHVPLRVVEDLEGGTAIELYIAAPEGLTGSVIVDVGLVEV
jgi:assimilatory nitrate reductase catalytic subunit